MTDFRALCAELNKWVIELAASHSNLSDSGIAKVNELVDRTVAALAQPEPQGPTDEQLRDLWSWAAGQDQGPWPTQQHCFARAVLTRWGNQ